MRISSVLVISVARIGDTVLLTPVLKAIKARYPQARLTVLAHVKRMEVLENLPCIDKLGAISKRTAVWQGWFSGKPYDAALVFGRDVALVQYALRVSKKVACFDEPEFSSIDIGHLIKIAPPQTAIHAVAHRLMLAEAIDVHDAEDLRLSFEPTKSELTAVAQQLARRGIAGHRPLIGLQLFSFPAKAHRDWPVASFSAFITGILKVFPDAQFIILGDQLAADRAEPLLQSHSLSIHVVAGQLGLRQSVALMTRLDLYLGVDTGPTHLAGALGIPMVALYHWKYPCRNLCPLQNAAFRGIEHPATGNPGGDLAAGMEAIPVDEVLAMALSLLQNELS